MVFPWLTLASALLIVASFPPWGFSFLIWFSLVPWFFALKRTSHWKQAATQGLLLSFFINLFGFFWIASVLHEFGALPWILSVIGFLLFSLIVQPQFICLAPFIRRSFSSKQEIWNLLGITFIYAGTDWLLPKIFKDTLGHAFYSSPNLRQVADLGGAHLLTALIFLVNGTVYRTLCHISEKKPKNLILQLVFTLLALTAAQIYGQHRCIEIENQLKKPAFSIQASAIQANIGDFDKIAAEQGMFGAAEKILNTYFSLSDTALKMTKKPDFLVWPETAYPSTFRTPSTVSERARDQKVEAFVQSRQTSLLFGGYDHSEGKDYNALFALSGSNPLQIYRKNMLLIFGEYIPGADQFKWIRDAFPQVGNFGRGKGPDLLSLTLARSPQGRVQFGPVICYEALFPDYVIEAARKGSQFILNITNDSWFGPYGEPPLHLALVSFRSIETRLPQLRSTNTGISALILPNGEITHPTRIDEKEILNVEIPILEPIPTLIKNWGDWFGPSAFLLGLAILIGSHQRDRLKQVKM